MSMKLRFAIKAAVAGMALTVSSGAYAAGTVGSGLPVSKWIGSDNVVGAGETIATKSGTYVETDALGNPVNINYGAFGTNNSWTDNASLNNSAWGHAVDWYTFQTTANLDIRIRDIKTSGSGSRDIAFTLWRTNGPFDGGSAYGDENNDGNASFNAPHSFNAVGQVGAPGTLWAADPSIAKANPAIDTLVTVGGGNLLQTVAYINGGIAHTAAASNDWNETINAGVNAVGGGFSSVGGSYSTNVAELTLNNLAAGWYVIALGGANSSLGGSINHQLSVAAVPVPGAVYLFGSALAGLIANSRRKLKLA